jgi:trehalose-6-phosphate synthase
MQADDDFGDATNREANMRFAEVVNGFVGKGDMVWVQDYHRASHQSQKA